MFQNVPAQTAQSAGQLQILAASELRIKMRLLRHVADGPQKTRPIGANVAAVKQDLALRRLDQPDQHFDGGALACTIRPQIAEDLAWANRKTDIIHGRNAIVALGEMVYSYIDDPECTTLCRHLHPKVVEFYQRPRRRLQRRNQAFPYIRANPKGIGGGYRVVSDMEATGLPSGTVSRASQVGTILAQFTNAGVSAKATAGGTPARKYYKLTALGDQTLAKAIQRYPLLQRMAAVNKEQA